MDETQTNTPLEQVQATPVSSDTGVKQEPNASANTGKTSSKYHKNDKHDRTKKSSRTKHTNKNKKKTQSSEETSSSEEKNDEDDSESSSSDEDTEADTKRLKRKLKLKKLLKRQTKKLLKKEKRNLRKHHISSSSESSSESESSEDDVVEEPRHERHNRANALRKLRNTNLDDLDEEDLDEQDDRAAQIDNIQLALDGLRMQKTSRINNVLYGGGRRGLGLQSGRRRKYDIGLSDEDTKGRSKYKYKRVDEIWDNQIHNYRLVDTADAEEDQYERYIFTVRRTFDWDNRPKSTYVDLRSKPLRNALKEVMKDVKGLVLDQDKPEIDPNMLYLYLEELRGYTKNTLKTKIKAAKKRKEKKALKLTRSHCRLMIRYLDEDYKEVKKSLKGLLKSGEITFDLLWALFKPNSIAFTPTYSNTEDPRCFKVEYANKSSSFMRGEWYSIEGQYLEYDGKSFGLGEFEADVDTFKGPKKITSLACYPLKYHKDVTGITGQLIERGKRFVTMEGMTYKAMKGMSYVKKKRGVAKVNINGRIVVDPATFRRINPNYPISILKPKEDKGECGSEDEESDCHGSGSGSGHSSDAENDKDVTKTKWIAVADKNDKTKTHLVQVAVDENGEAPHMEILERLSKQKREFTDEELLIASPVVLGFAFSEKLWLEFSLSGIRDIDWNEGAFESLVLPPGQKSIVKALVESHKYEAAKTIDDVVQGKGKGLVAVLHGPPGTGKTLTAEGIAELLKCPLYQVSVGELGTEPLRLEESLNRILDLAHTWGAIILLDEADVFLERRQNTDIHRNALVSVFLRLLEYFQGILFLTSNRVETFDEAFQSRIHLALKYGELAPKARRTVWKMFCERVHAAEAAVAAAAGNEVAEPVAGEGASTAVAAAPAADITDSTVSPAECTSTTSSSAVAAPPNTPTPLFNEADYDILARKVLNGRQIKNVVRTAQALALNEGKRMYMEHVRRVLEMQEAFEQDLKGGTGFVEAMRGYT